jgi:hypothetical protein
METKDVLLEDICKIANKVKPNVRMIPGCIDGGKGFVEESIFAFSKSGSFWIVVLCETGRVAFKKVTPEWIQAFSNLILSSPEVFVVFDSKHHIVEWAVAQDKTCPVLKEKHKEPPKDHKDHKDPKDHKDHKDCKDPKDHKDHKDHKDCKDPKDHKDCKDCKDHKDHKECKDYKDYKDYKDCKERK